jgi:diadenosine tetraphosphate (Ap4A) HIT family hydrolase
MKVVFAVETAIREVMHPDKINLASLGNKTPHVHWHIIPRFKNDKHFPNSHWAEAARSGEPSNLSETALTNLKEKIHAYATCALTE